LPTSNASKESPSPDLSSVPSLDHAQRLTCCAIDSSRLVAMTEPTLLAQAQGQPPQAATAGKKPNILFIMGDDIGWMQPSCYHRGLMVGETPNIDRLAAEGGMFTITQNRVAPPDVARSLLGCIRSALAWCCRSCLARFLICALERRVWPSSC
jgi:hypothetical protein